MKFVTLGRGRFSGAEVFGEVAYRELNEVRTAAIGFKRSKAMGLPQCPSGGAQNNAVSFAAIGRRALRVGPDGGSRGKDGVARLPQNLRLD